MDTTFWWLSVCLYSSQKSCVWDGYIGSHTVTGGDTPINYCSCSEFWNFCPEKKQFFKYLTAFLSNFGCCCCCVIWLLLLNDCFSLPLMLPSCSHTKLLLKWENIGSERVVWFHCGKHLDCVNFFPLVFTLLLIFFKTVFSIVQKSIMLHVL